MFSTIPTYTRALTPYTPHVSSPLSSSPLRNSPSPLSPRDANLPARKPYIEMSSPTPTSKSSRSFSTEISASSNTSPEFPFFETGASMNSALPSPPPSRGRAVRESVYSKRVTKSNPLMSRNADEGREARRKLFLKRVREGSEKKRWRDRHSGIGEGEDELLRSIWIAEERRRDEVRQREAMGVWDGFEEEEDGLFDEVMANEVAMEEEQELEALLESLREPQTEMQARLWDEQPTTQVHQSRHEAETIYGSDDEEYDHIFMDVIEEENKIASYEQQLLPGYLDANQEMMDIS